MTSATTAPLVLTVLRPSLSTPAGRRHAATWLRRLARLLASDDRRLTQQDTVVRFGTHQGFSVRYGPSGSETR